MKILVLNDTNILNEKFLRRGLSKVINKISYDNLGSDVLTENLGMDFGITDRSHKLFMIKKNLLWSDVVIFVTENKKDISRNAKSWIGLAQESFSNLSPEELMLVNLERKLHILTFNSVKDSEFLLDNLIEELSTLKFKSINCLFAEDILSDSSTIVYDNKALVSV